MLIEFALSVWTLFLLTFLIFEFCMTIYTYSVLNNAAREGVRYAIAHGTDSSTCSGPSTGCSDSTGASVTNVVKGYGKVSFHDLTSMTLACFMHERCRDGDQGTRLRRWCWWQRAASGAVCCEDHWFVGTG